MRQSAPALGVRLIGRRRRWTAAAAPSGLAASRNTISACTGSVSWNSSTNRCRYFCCSARRTCGVLAQDLRGQIQQVAVVQRVAPATLVRGAVARAREQRRPTGGRRTGATAPGTASTVSARKSPCSGSISVLEPLLLGRVRRPTTSGRSSTRSPRSSSSVGDDRRPVAPLSRDPQLAAELLAPPSESCTSCPRRCVAGSCFSSAVQNFSSAFHAGFGSGHIAIARRELDVLVLADDRERGVEILRPDAGVEQLEHVADRRRIARWR